MNHPLIISVFVQRPLQLLTVFSCVCVCVQSCVASLICESETQLRHQPSLTGKSRVNHSVDQSRRSHAVFPFVISMSDRVVIQILFFFFFFLHSTLQHISSNNGRYCVLLYLDGHFCTISTGNIRCALNLFLLVPCW